MAKGSGKIEQTAGTSAMLSTNLSISKHRSSSSTTTTSSSSTSNKKKPSAAPNTQSKRIKPSLLKGLTVIPPNKKDEHSLRVIEAFDKACRSDSVRNQLLQWCSDGLPGVRKIQGQRYEIFVQVKKYASNNHATPNAFDKIVREMLTTNDLLTTTTSLTANDVRRTLIQYAKEQAEHVPFISKQSYIFDNFSMLISYDKCQSQYPHIDLQKPNVQCALVVSDGSPPTRVFTCSSIQTVEDLQKHAWKKIPITLQDAIQNSPGATDLLQKFGDCLHPLPTEFPPASPLERGTLMGLEGSRLHAGPACETYRCILFFSG